MKVVILCGGRGLRLTGREPTLPKPLIEIGGRPILWHVMMGYAAYGYREFVLCLGHLGEAIKDYFIAREVWRDCDVRLRVGDAGARQADLLSEHHIQDFDVTFVDTGDETNSGERILRIAQHLGDDDHFFATYCDGLWDGDPRQLLATHVASGRLATLTAVRAPSAFGMLRLGESDAVEEFREKPPMDEWINGGFLVFSRAALERFRAGDELERMTLARMAEAGELGAFRHQGFWMCMDTYKETEMLDRMWRRGEAPWAKWRGGR